MVQAMQQLGLTATEGDEAVTIYNPQYPNMMLALKTLADACLQRDDVKMAKFLFASCDFRALDPGYAPDVVEMLCTVLSPAEGQHAAKLHHLLSEMAYKPTLEISGPSEWRIQYQGHRKIKATPFFEFEYDERLKSQRVMRVKCASTNRLVPLIAQQPDLLQQDFFRYAHACGAPKCSWCKTRKALGPSVIERAGEERTICWWMQRRFTAVDDEAVNLVKHYALLHEALLTA
jgi:hypothetical protein